MDQQDKSVIEDLFGKLRQAEGKTGPRDPEAEALIAEHIKNQPGAPYYMAQALVVQQDALANAQSRVQQLEQELTQRPQGGGFLAGLFGGGEQAPAPRRNVPAHAGRYRQQAQGGPWGGGGGGGFLAGAMQTALGVAGGVMIANALTGMLTADEAAAAELPPEDMAAGDDAGWEEPAADEFGGDDFDISGGAFDEF